MSRERLIYLPLGGAGDHPGLELVPHPVAAVGSDGQDRRRAAHPPAQDAGGARALLTHGYSGRAKMGTTPIWLFSGKVRAGMTPPPALTLMTEDCDRRTMAPA